MKIHREITTWIKLRQSLVLILFGFILAACSQNSDPQKGFISDDQLSAPLPNVIAALALDKTNLIVDMVVDGGKTLRVQSLEVDSVNGTFTGKISSIGKGPHTLSLTFSVIDPTYGSVELATTSDIEVDVIANQETPADFSSTTLTLTDTDGDGINNLDELDEGSNPTELSYYVGGSVSGLLGSGAVLQLNGGSDLPLTTDDGFKFVPALANNSTYTVTVATQPSNPSQTCTASNTGGTVSGANVTNVTAMCVTDDTTAPTVSSTSPIANAVDVARNSTVTATFDEDIFSSTVDGSSFTLLQANGDSVSGTVTFDGAVNIATFIPASKLAVHTSCIAIMTTAITDLSGNAIASNYTWSFTTADGTWVGAGLIETDNVGTASSPQIAFDGSGNAIAVWQQYDDIHYNIWANRYVAGKGWGSARLIETDNAGSMYSPQVAFDDSGNAIAVWGQDDSARSNIWANRYVAGKGWGSAGLIETDNAGSASRPQIAFDGSGNAIAVWRQYDGTRFNIWANRFE